MERLGFETGIDRRKLAEAAAFALTLRAPPEGNGGGATS